MPPVLGALAAGAGIAMASSAAPLSLLAFTSVGAAATAGGIGSTLAGVAGKLLLGTAISAAGAFLSKANTPNLGNSFNAPGVSLSSRLATQYMRRGYGTIIIGGALAFERVQPPYLYHLLMLLEGPIKGVNWAQNDHVKIGVDPATLQVLTPPYTGDRLRLSFRPGTADQAIDPIINAAFPGDPKLGPNWRQAGVATLGIRADYGQPHDNPSAAWEDHQKMWGQSGTHNLMLCVDASLIYDPRDPSCRLPTDWNDIDEVYAARATWKFSDTAALVQADYLMWQGGGRERADRMRWDEIAEAANYDEELIGTKSGELIKRHSISGVVSSEQEPVGVLGAMLTANRGFLVRDGGRISLASSRPRTPVLTITDDLICGPFEYRGARPRREVLNRLRPKFRDPRQPAAMVDGPMIDKADMQAADLDIYEGSPEFPFTQDHRQAQRLAELHFRDSRLGRTVTTTILPQALARTKRGDLGPAKIVRIYSKKIRPEANGLYVLMEKAMPPEIDSIAVHLVEYDPSVDRDWRPDVHEQDFDLPDLEQAA